MTTRFRTHAAAALMLLPLGLAMVAEPAAAQYGEYRGQAVAPASLIERFVMRPNGRLRAGEELRFRLDAVPGAQAWVDVPGVIGGLPLRETRSGRYEAEYVIRTRDDVDAFDRATATVQSGSVRQSARLDRRGEDRDERQGRDERRDERPPQITDVTPAQGGVMERGRARVAARFEDAGRAGVDPASVLLRIDGIDVTSRARISPEGVEFVDVFGLGRHTAELSVRDRAGNVARRNWSFDVTEARRAMQPTLQITSPTTDAASELRWPLTLEGRTAPNARVRVELRPNLFGQEFPSVEQVTRADADGRFSVRFLRSPMQRVPDYIDVEVVADVPHGPALQQHLRLRTRVE
ncbi:MAG TPA: hypothetical protein VF522_15220 [Ramlibacter sp.]|uniref:hypothetical protein n=1 Tax=Ramlibacter sp. TaxID=1917967 RepID=UPI002ED0D5BB